MAIGKVFLTVITNVRYGAILFHTIFTLAAQLILGILCVVHLVNVFRKKRTPKKVNSTFVLACIIIAALGTENKTFGSRLVRIVGYGGYMQYVEGKYSATNQRILFLLAILIWVFAASMTILYWFVNQND